MWWIPLTQTTRYSSRWVYPIFTPLMNIRQSLAYNLVAIFNNYESPPRITMTLQPYRGSHQDKWSRIIFWIKILLSMDITKTCKIVKNNGINNVLPIFQPGIKYIINASPSFQFTVSICVTISVSSVTYHGLQLVTTIFYEPKTSIA